MGSQGRGCWVPQPGSLCCQHSPWGVTGTAEAPRGDTAAGAALGPQADPGHSNSEHLGTLTLPWGHPSPGGDPGLP